MRTAVGTALRERRESGMAMVMTVAVMVLVAIITTTLLATTVFTTRNTTATRANVQAVAAAEAGVEAVAQTLLNGGACAGTYASPAAGAVDYAVAVHFRATPTSAWVQGCPPATADAVRITSTGQAESKGTGGNDRGDTAKVEMLLERPNPSPRFTRAIFGDLEMSIATALTVTPSDADLYTNGEYTCSTNTVVRGSVFAGGNATFSSAPCTVDGDVYVGGNFVCGGGLTIGGNLYVQGNITLSSPTCKVHGSLWSGGYTRIPNAGTPIGGDLFVRGNLDLSGVPTVGGQPRIRGSILGSHTAAFKAAEPSTVHPDPTLGPPPPIPPSPDNVFPKLYKTDPLWAGFADASWRGATDPIRPESWINICDIQGGAWTTPLTITSNTKFDVTKAGECPGGNLLIGGGGFKFVLKADAVIFVNKFTFGGGGKISVTSGDGDEHTLYIVHPWPTTQPSCPPAAAATETIQLTGTTWTQDAKARVFFYSPQRIKINGSPTIRGQMYGCNVRADTSVTLQYAPAGGAAVAPGLSGLDLQHIRDVTD